MGKARYCLDWKRLLLCGALGVSAMVPTAHATQQRSVLTPPSDLNPKLRPEISATWMSTETYRNGQLIGQGGWMGLRAAADAALLRWRNVETGILGHVFSSVFSMSARAGGGSAAEVQVQPYVLLRPGIDVLGDLHIRLSGGYFGNWRQGAAGQIFFPPIRAFQVRAEVSTMFDSRSRIGFVGSYALAELGVLQAGATFSQRLFGTIDMPWDFRIGLTASVARSSTLQENWTQVSLGIVGAL